MLREILVALLLAGCVATAPASPPDGTIGHRDAPDYHAVLHDDQGLRSVHLIVHAAPGYEPVQGVLDDVAAELARAIGKPVAAEIVPYETRTTAGSRWEVHHLTAAAHTVKAQPWPDGGILLHAVSLPGCYTTADRECVGGVEVRDVAFVFFDGLPEMNRSPDGLEPATHVLHRSVQRYILMHELGHAIGLVANPVPALDTTRIADDGCGCHSTEPDSVMSGRGPLVWLGDAGHGHVVGQAQRLGRGEFHNFRFNANDMADLRAYQEAVRGTGHPHLS